MVIISTDKIGHFFQEVGSPIILGRRPARPTADVFRCFLETSARYGYWNASAEENARIGITLPSP
jgi:hypothetical protein